MVFMVDIMFKNSRAIYQRLHHKQRFPNLYANLLAVAVALLSAMYGVIQYQTEILQIKILHTRSSNTDNLIKLVDSWQFFQAKSIKATQTELAMELLPQKSPHFLPLKKRYLQEQQQIKDTISGLQKTIDNSSLEIIKLINRRMSLLFSGVLLQIAVGLASIALLLRKNLVFIATFTYASFSFICALTITILNLYSGS